MHRKYSEIFFTMSDFYKDSNNQTMNIRDFIPKEVIIENIGKLLSYLIQGGICRISAGNINYIEDFNYFVNNGYRKIYDFLRSNRHDEKLMINIRETKFLETNLCTERCIWQSIFPEGFKPWNVDIFVPIQLRFIQDYDPLLYKDRIYTFSVDQMDYLHFGYQYNDIKKKFVVNRIFNNLKEELNVVQYYFHLKELRKYGFEIIVNEWENL